uniref:Uncharacterized protein n=1 Tax=Anguilla anguilla TaxID=7936 RepID=A0A0E9TC51_ANGAN
MLKSVIRGPRSSPSTCVSQNGPTTDNQRTQTERKERTTKNKKNYFNTTNR